MNENEYCQEKTLKSGSSFYYSFLFLDKARREAITAVYALCRELDDIVDKDLEPHIAEQKLAWWQTEIERLYKNQAQHPIAVAMSQVVVHYHIPKILLDELVSGMLMDLKYQGYTTFQDLKLYCHCAASTVGLMAARIFGFSDDNTLIYAKNLGIALQLVNIIRDVGEDAKRGRVYLPEEDLTRFSLTSDDILNLQESPELKALLHESATRARMYYTMALEALPECDRYAQRAGLIMADIYFNLLKEIERSNFAVLNSRISLSPFKKLWLAWRKARFESKRFNTMTAMA